MIEIILKKSLIGRHPKQREALRCLGLKRINQTKTVSDRPEIWGQLNKVLHLVEVKRIKKQKGRS